MIARPPTPASPVLPPEGEDLEYQDLPPLGEVARSAEGGLVSVPLPLIAGLFAPELGIFAIGRNQGLVIAALNHSASL